MAKATALGFATRGVECVGYPCCSGLVCLVSILDTIFRFCDPLVPPTGALLKRRCANSPLFSTVVTDEYPLKDQD
ncbi:Sentrin-specific protease 2 [Sciurus carolinensis]|uniref:Sentrin-specific protease 2 n=1 Tax=Sciurus carolinensis TaxID=30640 RepID=A0AA41TBM8_SCICA|nr:Sentrin-specific protease 2 [Sciurus carolinensis]